MAALGTIYLRNGGSVSLESIRKMRDSLKVLGTDRDQALAMGRFGLAWTFDQGFTPQDLYEQQPVMAGERWALQFIGFLMHREELAQRLNIAADRLDKIADSQLVMDAWCKWGERCLDYVYGRFSLIICDLEKQAIIAARSIEGGPTLFYHDSQDRLVITTSVRGIFCFPEIPKEVDEQKIADALVLNFEDRSRTFYENVHALPSGHILKVDQQRTQVSRYYDFGSIAEVRYANDGSYVEAASELLENAVASSMRACETPAISLSSGLDSSAVAVTMLDHLRQTNNPKPLNAYVSIPEPGWDGRARLGRTGDEQPPIRALMARYPNLNVQFIDSEGLEFDHQIEEIHAYAEMPMRGVGNVFWGQEIARQCRRDGHRILLNGSSGNGTLSAQCAGVLFGQWFRAGRWVRLLQEYRQYRRGLDGDQGRFVRRLLGSVVVPQLPDSLYDRLIKLRTGAQYAGYQSFSAIQHGFAKSMDAAQRLDKFDVDDRFRPATSRRALIEQIISSGTRDHGDGFIEPSKVLSGVQGRDPLGDRKIVEFCYGIPDDQFYKNGTDRRLIKRMMVNRLPPEIIGATRGDQSADWHYRMTRSLKRIDDELERFGDDPELAQRIDIDRMRETISNWPKLTPRSHQDHPEFEMMRLAIPRAISIARFINRVKGKNR